MGRPGRLPGPGRCRLRAVGVRIADRVGVCVIADGRPIWLTLWASVLRRSAPVLCSFRLGGADVGWTSCRDRSAEEVPSLIGEAGACGPGGCSGCPAIGGQGVGAFGG